MRFVRLVSSLIAALWWRQGGRCDTIRQISHPGQLPKWPNGADCKSAVFDFGSSNLSLPTQACPCGAEVAHSLGKTGVMGSIPITGSRGF